MAELTMAKLVALAPQHKIWKQLNEAYQVLITHFLFIYWFNLWSAPLQEIHDGLSGPLRSRRLFLEPLNAFESDAQ